MTRLSAAMDGQPRHQHRPPSAASHRTIARRMPAPLAAQRARRQRRLKASSHSHTHIRQVTIAPTTLASSSSSNGRSSYKYLQQYLYEAQIKGDRAIATTAEDTRSVTDQGRPSGGGTSKNVFSDEEEIRKEYFGGLPAARTFGEFKGCPRHSSKGGS